MSENHADVAIIGAGIVGLAHALAAAKRGLKVVVFDRTPTAVGASIRNFGMVWPIGQPAGFLLDRALRSREIWLEVAAKAGFHADRSGSLHLAYRQDELDVLREFVETRHPPVNGGVIALLTPEQVMEKSPAAVKDRLLGGLWSATEVIVDPREAIAKIPAFLTQAYGVEFKFNRAVTEIAHPTLKAGDERWSCDRIYVCSGADFETLYPAIYQESGITKVKLQMLRTIPQPDNWRLGAALCAGLTLTHYKSFDHCATLPALKERIKTETPYFVEWGIHVMVSQNYQGELIIGDTHEYGLNPNPFDRADLNKYILDYFQTFANPPSLHIAETWHGIYAKILDRGVRGQGLSDREEEISPTPNPQPPTPSTELIAHPEPGVTIVNALGGAGMTLSFGLAEEVVAMEL
ncbi:TIGR03364 family FAD-dependent oxidoreductase [Floridanema evergladense]|uniref:TIGR03364 family FAD-dependent oxidoreductase n=1 Tax=Floridaenema evergladense BLCC-F167 TaxID=3153639 RepID=A0ABV4WIH2_9CYAN